MKYTTHYNFKKPEKTDFYNIDDSNYNTDKTEEALIAKADKVTNNGFIAGNNAANAAGGVAIGNYAKVSGAGGAIGSEAEAKKGFAGGYSADSTGNGASVGCDAHSYHGFAGGNCAQAGSGAAVGDNAKCGTLSNGADIDCIQLGKGTNGKEFTLQTYNYQITSCDGTPSATSGKYLTDVGKLSDLKTNDKSNIVSALNELADFNQSSAIAIKFSGQITAPSYDVDINSNGNWEQMFNIPAIEVTCAEFDKITIPAQQIHVAETYDLGSDWNCYIEYYKFNGNIQSSGVCYNIIKNPYDREFFKIDTTDNSISKLRIYIGNIKLGYIYNNNNEKDYYGTLTTPFETARLITNGNSKTSKSSTITFAANNSSIADKLSAVVLCDGTNDRRIIHESLKNLNGARANIEFKYGTYNLNIDGIDYYSDDPDFSDAKNCAIHTANMSIGNIMGNSATFNITSNLVGKNLCGIEGYDSDIIRDLKLNINFSSGASSVSILQGGSSSYFENITISCVSSSNDTELLWLNGGKFVNSKIIIDACEPSIYAENCILSGVRVQDNIGYAHVDARNNTTITGCRGLSISIKQNVSGVIAANNSDTVIYNASTLTNGIYNNITS